MASKNAVRLPRGRQFVLTWGIPDSYGGMTGALLHRSRAFVSLARCPVDILTLDDRVDYPEVERRLRAQGEIVDGIRILNIWDWLSQDDHGTVRESTRSGHTLITPDESVRELSSNGVVRLREKRSAKGETVAVDRFRADGTLLVTDRRNPDSGTRSVALYDHDGQPVREWGSIWGLYRYWLDRVIGSEQSFLIVDSKTAARFARTYRRKNVVTFHVVHGSHRTADGSGLAPSRRAVMEHLDDFDGAVLLTRQQCDDVTADLGPRSNSVVVPNGLGSLAGHLVEASGHVRGRGVMLASLVARKRVSHAVRAIACAAELVDVSLDVFGEGERRPLLEATIQELGMTRSVTLRGHDDAARSAFADADFMLLTSSAEGLPLALVEGMAAGCIPIAYDIAYGPADVIDDGRNGFLVPAGDIDALAAQIVRLQRMPPAEVDALRRAAMATAERFDDVVVTEAWARAMTSAYARKHADAAAQAEPRRVRSIAGRIKRRLLG